MSIETRGKKSARPDSETLIFFFVLRLVWTMKPRELRKVDLGRQDMLCIRMYVRVGSAKRRRGEFILAFIMLFSF